MSGRGSAAFAACAFVLAGPSGAAAGPTFHAGRLELFGGAHADGYSTLDGADALFGGLAADGELVLPRGLATQLEVMAGTYGGDGAGALAARLYHRGVLGTLGVSAGYTDVFDHQTGLSVGLFAERHEARALIVSASLGYEAKDPTEDLYTAELMLHLMPTDHLLIQTGVSYAQARIKQTRADIVIHLEYAGVPIGGATVAGYVQYGGNLFTRGAVGLVVYFDRLDVSTRRRTRGVHGLRFK